MKAKFNLADVLALIAIMAYGFFVFLSANFLEWGDMQKTIIWTGCWNMRLNRQVTGPERVS